MHQDAPEFLDLVDSEQIGFEEVCGLWRVIEADPIFPEAVVQRSDW